MVGWKIYSTRCSKRARWLAACGVIAALGLFAPSYGANPDQDPGDEPENQEEAPPEARPLMQQQQPPPPSQPPLETQRRPSPPANYGTTSNRQNPPPATGSPTLRAGEMLFNFQDADIQAVVKTVSQMTNRNFLIDPRVKGKVTIISSKPVSGAAIYQIFLSALKAQGFTAVEGPGGIVKIVPEGEGKQNATVSVGDSPKGGDQLATQVVIIQHGSATQMVPLLRPLMAPSALLSVYAPGNALIITDYADNIRRLLKIIDKLDQPGSTEVVIIPLEHASALDMGQLLGRLADNVTIQVGQAPQPPQAGGDASRVSIVPDMRTNSLLVRTDNQGRLNQIRSLISKLDVPARQGGNTRVVYLRNAQATKLAEVLRGLLAGEARAQPAQATPAVGGAQPVAAAAARTAEASLIQADEASNALIISAPDAIYNNLRAVIEKLDVRRAQVFVEALIAEVGTERTADFGFQWAAGGSTGADSGVVGLQNFPQGPGLVGVATGIAGGGTGLPALNGLSVAFLGNEITLPDGQTVYGLGALARALSTINDVNVLSTPNLLTLDNSEAKIVIAQNVPFITGRFTQTGTGSNGQNNSVNPFQTIERKDVGLTLKIKPQISEGNGIKLEISQEVSDVTRIEDAQDLATNKRSLDTTVIVDDGFTIVLGGLIQDRVSEDVSAVPILSRIPLLGELFKYRKRLKRKTNLMIFLRPLIVRNIEQSQSFTADRYEYMKTLEQKMKLGPSMVLPRYDSPMLPDLKQPPIPVETPVRKGDSVSPEKNDTPPPTSESAPAVIVPNVTPAVVVPPTTERPPADTPVAEPAADKPLGPP